MAFQSLELDKIPRFDWCATIDSPCSETIFIDNPSYRDHYRDSITEYTNECKDNHDGYDNMGHPNQHHPGKSIVTFFKQFISWFDSFLSA